MDTCIGSQLYEKGWKQGAYIKCTDLSDALREACWAGSPSLANDIVKELSETRNTLILLTQACDIAASCNNEPTLEFVIARRPKKKDLHIHLIWMLVAVDTLNWRLTTLGTRPKPLK